MANANSALPDSTALTFAMPAPGVTRIEKLGMFFSKIVLSAPPTGYHDPPCGPVANLISDSVFEHAVSARDRVFSGGYAYWYLQATYGMGPVRPSAPTAEKLLDALS